MCEISTDMSRTTELKGEGGKKKKKEASERQKKMKRKYLHRVSMKER